MDKNIISSVNHTGAETRTSKMSESKKPKFCYPSTEFVDFLNKHRISSKKGSSRVATHWSMCQPLGKFSIPQNEMETFMTLYEGEVKRGSTLGIAEVPLAHLETPLVADFDFKYKLENKPLHELRRHNYKVIKDILTAYKKVYDEHFYFLKSSQVFS